MQNLLLKKLQSREEQHLLRELQLPSGVDFCSNDYLSFASDSFLQRKIQTALSNVPSGATGSRLLRGHCETHVKLELSLAKFCSREEALFLPSGYQANLALLSAVLNQDSIVFSDQLNHASIIDGIKLSGCKKVIFAHNDLSDLENKLSHSSHDIHKVVIIESLYSMRGDFSPLKEMATLCLKYNAQLIVDEMHATGLYGAGLVQRHNLQNQTLATVHGAGKALGISGAWIACDSVMKDYLVNFSRPFIYSTAPSPLIAEAVHTALEHWHEAGEARAELCIEKAQFFTQQLKVFLVDDMISGDGPIIFINLKDSQIANYWAQSLQMKGFDVRAIRYPTVPEDQAGLRVILHANHAIADITTLISAIRHLVIEC